MDIRYSKQAEKFLKKQDAATRKRIRSAIQALPSGDVKKLQGRNGYRLRVGDVTPFVGVWIEIAMLQKKKENAQEKRRTCQNSGAGRKK